MFPRHYNTLPYLHRGYQALDVHVYIEKVEKKIKELAKSNPTIKRIEEDKPLTEKDFFKNKNKSTSES